MSLDILMYVVGPAVVIITFAFLLLMWYVESERCLRSTCGLSDKVEPLVDVERLDLPQDRFITGVDGITLDDLPVGVDRLPRHRYHHCEITNCVICENGIVLCEVCGGIDILTTDCPGARLSMEVKELVEDGLIDYTREGRWTNTSSY